MERAAAASFLRDSRMPPRSTHPRHHQQNPLRRGRGGHAPGVCLLHHGVYGRTSSTTASVSSTTASAPAALLHHHGFKYNLMIDNSQEKSRLPNNSNRFEFKSENEN
ncbi:hypothetical protein QYE76_000227 [Lolium multiflorum]|uniref:Uncharacterized protein n=1 Tax=Lolium multiflorum TaxID=4521 RepID=A0AAD8RJV0_LOLMU|nr:hypothetical protein QYE76_000227 [Lolium multiflorum]